MESKQVAKRVERGRRLKKLTLPFSESQSKCALPSYNIAL